MASSAILSCLAYCRLKLCSFLFRSMKWTHFDLPSSVMIYHALSLATVIWNSDMSSDLQP